MSSFIAQIMEPGGGLLLLPFVRLVICCLLLLTTAAAVANLARIHMIILSVLSTGLLISLYWFETEFRKLRNNQSNSTLSSTATTSYANTKNAGPKNNNKTD